MAWKFDSFLYSKLRNNQNYDEEDRFIKENKDYWYEKGGRKRMVSASKVLRFDLTEYVTKTGNYDLSEIQTQALSNIVTTQIVREVVKKFVKNCNPEEFFANGGDDRHLAIVLARECQQLLGPKQNFAPAWCEKDSRARKMIEKVTAPLVPFMLRWQNDQGFYQPTKVQDAACMTIVAERLVDEVIYKYVKETNPIYVSTDPIQQTKQIFNLAKLISNSALRLLDEEVRKNIDF